MRPAPVGTPPLPGSTWMSMVRTGQARASLLEEQGARGPPRVRRIRAPARRWRRHRGRARRTITGAAGAGSTPPTPWPTPACWPTWPAPGAPLAGGWCTYGPSTPPPRPERRTALSWSPSDWAAGPPCTWCRLWPVGAGQPGGWWSRAGGPGGQRPPRLWLITRGALTVGTAPDGGRRLRALAQHGRRRRRRRAGEDGAWPGRVFPAGPLAGGGRGKGPRAAGGPGRPRPGVTAGRGRAPLRAVLEPAGR